MSQNFPVDEEGNWLSLPEDVPEANRHNRSEKRLWLKSNPILNSFIEQVREIAPLRHAD